MSKNVYVTVAQYSSCVRNANQYKHKRCFQLFPTKEASEIVAIDILGTIPKTLQENQYVLYITDHYFKLTRAKPSSNLQLLIWNICSSTTVKYHLKFPLMFLQMTHHGSWASYTSQSADNWKLSTSPTNLTTHKLIDSHAGQFSKTIVTRLRLYVVEHERNWKIFVKPLTYAYNK